MGEFQQIVRKLQMFDTPTMLFYYTTIVIIRTAQPDK
jgi:hypothetical protein